MNTCTICASNGLDNPGKLFVVVTQPGSPSSKAHVCQHCFDTMTAVSHKYPGLTIEEISQQEFNESPAWRQRQNTLLTQRGWVALPGSDSLGAAPNK